MILHIPTHGPPLSEYGILIPASPGRTKRVLDQLRLQDDLAEKESSWLIGPGEYVIDRRDLERVHTKEYLDRIYSDEIGSVMAEVLELYDADGRPNRYNPDKATRPLSDLFDNRLVGLAGSYQVCIEALDRGFCFYFGGGAHHAHPSFGHGFCLLNDACVAIRRLQHEDKIRTAWIIDVDVHKGDGTAAIMRGDDSVLTLSAHMAHGWPLDGPALFADGVENPAYIPSDIDIPIDSGEEADYVPRFESALDSLLDLPNPDLAIVLLGADPYEHDGLPSTSLLRLSLEQLFERDRLVYGYLKNRRIPQAYLMAGGYGERAWEPYPAFLEYALRKELSL